MKTSILFVCMGNICRSPTAEGVFRKLSTEHAKHLDIDIDSAGTIGYHAGEHADTRSIKAAKARGYDLSQIISRKVVDEDFELFDLIIAMDADNHANLLSHAQKAGKEHYQHKVKMFLDYSEQETHRDVPDPYYGGAEGFNLVIDLIEDASLGLIKSLNK